MQKATKKVAHLKEQQEDLQKQWDRFENSIKEYLDRNRISFRREMAMLAGDIALAQEERSEAKTQLKSAVVCISESDEDDQDGIVHMYEKTEWTPERIEAERLAASGRPEESRKQPVKTEPGTPRSTASSAERFWQASPAPASALRSSSLARSTSASKKARINPNSPVEVIDIDPAAGGGAKQPFRRQNAVGFRQRSSSPTTERAAVHKKAT